jgi:hypothetical protein
LKTEWVKYPNEWVNSPGSLSGLHLPFVNSIMNIGAAEPAVPAKVFRQIISAQPLKGRASLN